MNNIKQEPKSQPISPLLIAIRQTIQAAISYKDKWSMGRKKKYMQIDESIIQRFVIHYGLICIKENLEYLLREIKKPNTTIETVMANYETRIKSIVEKITSMTPKPKEEPQKSLIIKP
jgi:predicted component of type VI protein secretion system